MPLRSYVTRNNHMNITGCGVSFMNAYVCEWMGVHVRSEREEHGEGRSHCQHTTARNRSLSFSLSLFDPLLSHRSQSVANSAGRSGSTRTRPTEDRVGKEEKEEYYNDTRTHQKKIIPPELFEKKKKNREKIDRVQEREREESSRESKISKERKFNEFKRVQENNTAYEPSKAIGRTHDAY
jgi:hypothetical protein